MIGTNGTRIFSLILATTWLTLPAFGALLGPSGVYTENFDSMGTASTAPPSGWQVYTITGGSGYLDKHYRFQFGSGGWRHSRWHRRGRLEQPAPASSRTIIRPGIRIMATTQRARAAATSDRGIATAPTGVSGGIIELHLTNGTLSPISGLTVSYDMLRYQVGADDAGRNPPAGIPQGSEELPGYWLFYSLDNGTTYTAVNSLIPVGAGPSSQPIVPNTVGLTSVSNASFNVKRQLECWIQSRAALGRRQCD